MGVHQRECGVDLALRLRRHPAAGRGHPACRLEGAEPRLDDGQAQPEPRHQGFDRRMQRQAAVEDDAGQRREAFCGMGAEHSEDDVGAVTGSDHRDPLGQPLQHVLGGHACHQNVQCLARQQFGVAPQHRALDSGLQLGNRRRDQQRFFGQHITSGAEPAQRGRDVGHARRIASVDHHRGSMSVLGGDLVDTQFDHLRDLIGRAALGLDGEHDRGAEVGRDPGVHRQLAGCRDVRVVAAHDQHRVAFVCDMMEAVDDVTDALSGSSCNCW